MSNIYNERYYDDMLRKNPQIAEVLMPTILDVINPKSVIDFGCGIGAFLVEPQNRGIRFLGIDGEYLDRKRLLISEDNFMVADLSKKVEIPEKYDLAISFEVAEHVNKENAEIFVENITNVSDVVVFSAAIPRQTGRGHVNLQPTSYWCDLFKKKGYVASNCLRKVFWKKNVSPLRRQNIMLFAKRNRLQDIERTFEKMGGDLYDIVHPEFLGLKLDECVSIYEEKLNFNISKYMMVENELAGVKLAEFLSLLSLYEMISFEKEIEAWYELKGFVENFKCNELESFENKNKQKKYFVWGAGEDGKAIIRILKILKKDIRIVADRNKAGTEIDGFMITKPEKAMAEWTGENIILASRKYKDEMLKELDLKMVKYVL